MADPKLNELTSEAKALNKELSNLKKLLGEFGTSASHFKDSFNTVNSSIKTAATTANQAGDMFHRIGTGSGGSGTSQPSRIQTVWTTARQAVTGASTAAEVRSAGGTWTQAAMSAGRSINFQSNNKPGSGDTMFMAKGMLAGAQGLQTATSAMSPVGGMTGGGSGGGGGGGIGGMIGGIAGGGGGIGGLLNSGIGMLQKASDIYGAVSGAGLQFAYNRIESPTGNRNTTLQLAQALAPNAGMMGMSVENLLTGLAQRAPVLGSNADIVNTILAGQSVGALMSGKNAPAESGVPGRTGFFESVRQMQLLTPGAAAGGMANVLSNYIGNTQSQQRGMYLGQGAFTMIGQGGRYKSLAEWAEAILKFLSEQRPGKAQGQKFGKDELMAQNFPGSNINAWFQMMGVPQDMVDYWWQYALTNAGQPSPVTSQLMEGGPSQTEILQKNIQGVRGMDLGYERLRSTTQATRRDYLMGTQMYGLYNAREAADRRFNVGMQAADLTIGQMARTTNAGAAMALLPTPIMELLLPMMTKLASSPIGTALSLAGNLKGAIGGVTNAIGGAISSLNPFGDPIGDPVGDYGPTGSMSTAHLSPDLAKRVDAMLSANPRLKISSGYRDTVTQNRLYRNGVGRVGPASKSAHTRGWAVDIGPTSELGWVQANAGKFGLQTASHAGEPWHVQMDGTMPIGDFASMIAGGLGTAAGIGLGSAFGPVGGAIGGLIGGGITGGGGPIMDLLTKFITGGSMSSLIDNAISMFIKLMTAPISGLAQAFGTHNITASEISDLVNKPSSVKINVSKYAGFTPATNPAITGKNSPPIFGDPISLASSQPATISAKIESPIIFKTDLHISGGAGNNPIDIQKTAVSIADALEAEYAKRSWRKS